MVVIIEIDTFTRPQSPVDYVRIFRGGIDPFFHPDTQMSYRLLYDFDSFFLRVSSFRSVALRVLQSLLGSEELS